MMPARRALYLDDCESAAESALASACTVWQHGSKSTDELPLVFQFRENLDRPVSEIALLIQGGAQFTQQKIRLRQCQLGHRILWITLRDRLDGIRGLARFRSAAGGVILRHERARTDDSELRESLPQTRVRRIVASEHVDNVDALLRLGQSARQVILD
jgi:hypothetical protein